MNRFPNRARVCFVGDSLVASNLPLPRIIDHYNKYFPESEVRFFNCGTSGGTYKSAIEFFHDDVLSHNPTHVVVAFGINDSDRWRLTHPRSDTRLSSMKRTFEKYKENVRAYCDLVLSHGIKLIICTPSPYDEYSPSETSAFQGGYALLLGYADFIRTFAKERGIELCDYHDYMSRMIETDLCPVISPDRVHPTSHGYYLLAKCFLLHQGLEIDKEAPISEYFSDWSAHVDKLRLIFGAEHMIVHDYSMPLEEKMTMMEKKVRDEDWGQPVFERFIRGFVAEKRNQKILYEKIDELYERDIFKSCKN